MDQSFIFEVRTVNNVLATALSKCSDDTIGTEKEKRVNGDGSVGEARRKRGWR